MSSNTYLCGIGVILSLCNIMPCVCGIGGGYMVEYSTLNYLPMCDYMHGHVWGKRTLSCVEDTPSYIFGKNGL